MIYVGDKIRVKDNLYSDIFEYVGVVVCVGNSSFHVKFPDAEPGFSGEFFELHNCGCRYKTMNYLYLSRNMFDVVECIDFWQINIDL